MQERKTITKRHLIDEVRERVGVGCEVASDLVELILQEISDIMMDENIPLLLTGVGTFAPKYKTARPARNPLTLEPAVVAPRTRTAFSPSIKFQNIMEAANR